MMRDVRRLCCAVAVLALLTGPLALSAASRADAAHTNPMRATSFTAPSPASCPRPVKLVNGGFEQPTPPGPVGFFPDASQNRPNSMPGWRTTAIDHLIEIWSGPPNPTSTPAFEGKQFVELNGTQFSTLYQDLPTTPGVKLYWRLSHRGRQGTDTMALLIGAPGAEVQQQTMSDGTIKWGTYPGTYTVPPGQTTTRFALRAVSSIGGPTIGNFLDGISFGTAPCNHGTNDPKF
jgi:hypothetical protein